MITLLIGENSFEIERYLRNITKEFDGETERINGDSLQLAQLPDILMGVSLFRSKRVVIIRGLSNNKTIWPIFGEWLNRVSQDIDLIIVEPKPDKRTSTFKALKKNATVKEFSRWTDRDVLVAEKWVMSEASKLGFDLVKDNAKFLVQRVGMDQWQLANSLDKLSFLDEISIESIKEVIDANPIENVFNLFETALRNDIYELRQILKILEQNEEVYRLLALLSTQAFQLAVVASASKTDNVAKDFGIHPYVVSKLEPIARKVGKTGVSKIISIFSEADDDIKKSRAEPWFLVERALIKIAKI